MEKMEAKSEPDQVIVVPGNVPAFLLKLWNIVENPTYEHLVSWNHVFIIYFKLCNGVEKDRQGLIEKSQGMGVIFHKKGKNIVE